MSEGKSVGFRLSAREAKKLNIIEKGKLTTLIYLFFFFFSPPLEFFVGKMGHHARGLVKRLRSTQKRGTKGKKKKKKKKVSRHISLKNHNYGISLIL